MDSVQLQLWEKKEREIVDYISEKLNANNWGMQPFYKNSSTFQYFINHLSFVILSFLNEDNGKELFIQIPTEELANKTFGDNGNARVLQDELFNMIAETVAYCLKMSTAESTFEKVIVPDGISYRNGDEGRIDWYEVGDVIYANHVELGDIFWMCDLNSKGNRRLFCKRKNNVEWNLSEERLRQCSNLFKIVGSSVNRNGKLQGRILDEVKKEVDAIRKYGNTKQYSKAVFASCETYFPKQSRKMRNYLNEQIDFESDFKSLSNTDSEIIVAFSDVAYLLDYKRYRNSEAKKIIYIGSDFPDHSIQTYPFTYREIYWYCSGGHNVSYIEPKITLLRFQWLEDVAKGFDNLMQNLQNMDAAMSNDLTRKLKSYLLYPFTDVRFDEKVLGDSQKEFDFEWLVEKGVVDVDTSFETIKEIEKWYKGLKFEEDNPKRVFLSDRKDNPLIIYRNCSFKNRIKRLKGNRNQIIIDCASNNPRYNGRARDNAYRYCVKNHLFANIECLYYDGFEDRYKSKLQEYLDEEIDVYKKEQRVKYGTSFDLSKSNSVSGTLSHFCLEDYFDSLDDERSFFVHYSESDQCCVVFKSNEQAVVDGDVLVEKGKDFVRVPIDDVEGYEENDVKIVYYSRPDIFDELARCYSNLPIREYSDLWKTKYVEYLGLEMKRRTKKDAILEIHEKTGIGMGILLRYSLENNQNYFLSDERSMKKMCDFLIEKELIMEEEKKYICAARRHHHNNKCFGRNLKDELLKCYTNSNVECVILDQLCENTGYTKQDLVKMCLKTGIIKSIVIRTK